MRRCAVLLWMICSLLLGTACQSSYPKTDIPDPTNMPAYEGELEWGVSLSAENVSNTGLTLVFTQSEGAPTGELMTGEYYIVEVFSDGQWVEVKWQQENRSWTDIAYILPMEGSRQLEVNWEDGYGFLPAGSYRIGKEVKDFRGPSNYDKAMYYAYFSIIAV